MTQFEFVTPIDIRFVDLDAYGHVNNALFFTYLETARIKLFQEYFGAFLDSHLMFLVVRAECDYRLPIELNDTLLVSVRPDKVRHSSFVFNYTLHDGDNKTYAEAKTVMVCYDPRSKSPAPLPPEIKIVLDHS